MRRVVPAVAAAFAAILLGALPAMAQTPELDRQRQRLEEIRQERARLQQQQNRIQGRVTDVNAQLRNIEGQRNATSALVAEIERQIGDLGSELERSAAEMALAEDNLLERKAVLQRRLVDIYKRGPLYTFQVLLAAESFGDLLTRYKYLYMTSRQDRQLVRDVERLTERVRDKRNELLGIRTELDRRREERSAELERYGLLAQQQQSTLRQLQQSSTQTRNRLTALQRDEARINEILANLERTRRNAPAPAGGGLTTASLGRLEWPVEGTIAFQFGRQNLPTGGTIIRNGIGIGAPLGTPVRAVESGTVVLRQRLSTYGLTMIIDHGNGYLSLYAQLGAATVNVDSKVTRGQIIGSVGGEGADEGPHLYFEIRGQNQIALDPLTWLRRRQ